MDSKALQNLVIGDFGKVRQADNTLDVTSMGDIVLKTPVGWFMDFEGCQSCSKLNEKFDFC